MDGIGGLYMGHFEQFGRFLWLLNFFAILFVGFEVWGSVWGQFGIVSGFFGFLFWGLWVIITFLGCWLGFFLST